MSQSDVIESSDPRGSAQSTLDPPQGAGGSKAAAVLFPELRPTAGKGVESPLDRIYDLSVPVTVELGRATLSVQEILELTPGSIVELDRAAEAPVELFVHGKCVAKGQVVVVDGYYGIRITALSS